jgi:hypothetical protein
VTIASCDKAKVGPDQSSGKDNLMLGTRVISEETLRHKLCPQRLPEEVKSGLGDQVFDVVAQPGGNLTTDADYGVMGLAEALQNLKGEHQIAIRGHIPSFRRYTKCMTLREIRSLEFLQKRYDTLNVNTQGTTGVGLPHLPQ